ncbi:DUF1016 family protein [Kribbella antibiotica]|uniref:DUF1016 family protein n=1 Tax=Kribbella antibiotica TaxID=190195 RepID=A0A4R4YW31_9ACTN|nr:PDDEXK nuclease domain-containing protein [Kribbella antibiotica]TDD49090.1 DUF1016 family protein [Kribbella antibiotica]
MNDKPRFESAPARSSLPTWYPDLLDSISQHITTGHRRAVTAANQQVLASYWSVGSEILLRQDEQGWGSRVIDRLSTDLKDRFPGATGYSPRNLKYMRAFAVAWPDPEFVQHAAAQIPWGHHMVLLDKLDKPELRLWYAAAAVDRGWSRGVLTLHIEAQFHERSGKAISNFATAMPAGDSDLAQQATRDPYLFDFLGTTDGWQERDVERGLVDHVGKFLLELGQGFAFIGQQVRLELGGEEFFCDLLLYHVKLHCFICTASTTRWSARTTYDSLGELTQRVREQQRIAGRDFQGRRPSSSSASTTDVDVDQPRWTHGPSETVVQWPHHDQPGRLTARADFLSPKD